jgi:hypothetical protein
MTNSQITPQEMVAIQTFAIAHGRGWKTTLANTYWYNARLWRDENGDTGHGESLHGLRNRLGPIWLRSFRLPKSER